jgi:hypothetical protein
MPVQPVPCRFRDGAGIFVVACSILPARCRHALPEQVLFVLYSSRDYGVYTDCYAELRAGNKSW